MAGLQQGPACPPGLPGLSHGTGRDGVPGPPAPTAPGEAALSPWVVLAARTQACLFQKCEVHALHSAAGGQRQSSRLTEGQWLN